MNIDGKVEHFDVYGEVQTVYSQVNSSDQIDKYCNRIGISLKFIGLLDKKFTNQSAA